MGELRTVTTAQPSTDNPINYGPPEEGIFKHISKVIPYFRNARNVLVFKLDVMLLAWMFLAGIMKEMDQSATTQAYVSGMRESLSLYGNELVEFNTYFSIGYALGLVPGQLIQTRVCNWRQAVYNRGFSNIKTVPTVHVSPIL